MDGSYEIRSEKDSISQGEIPEGVPQQLLAQIPQENGQMTPEQEVQIQKMMNGGFRKGVA
ncbi:MAG: hypothetical protein RSA53_08305 [Odoribacter sp.]